MIGRMVAVVKSIAADDGKIITHCVSRIVQTVFFIFYESIRIELCRKFLYVPVRCFIQSAVDTVLRRITYQFTGLADVGK